MNIKRTIQYYYLRIIRLSGSPRSLALGVAVGAAIGITPTLPLHTVLIISVTLAMRVNTIAGIIAGTLVSNPLTFLIQYYLAWWLGDRIFPDRLTWERIKAIVLLLMEEGLLDSLKTISALGFDTIVVMMTGGLILAIPTGLIFYLLSYRFFCKMQLKRQEKHLLN